MGKGEHRSRPSTPSPGISMTTPGALGAEPFCEAWDTGSGAWWCAGTRVGIKREEGRYVETGRRVIQSLFIPGRRFLHSISSHSCQNGCPKAGSQGCGICLLKPYLWL